MKNLKALLFIMLGIMCTSQFANAQRYTTEVFANVDVQYDVKYAENYTVISGTATLDTLYMDVYQPNGDTVTDRPLVILLHAGSFLPKGPFLPFGDKQDSSFIEMATQLAKRGFVAASVGYRIGWNPLGATQEDRSASIVNAVYRAKQDAHAAIRYFRKDAATSDLFNIDPYRVAVGGSNSGGYVSIAVNAMNKVSEIMLLKFRHAATGASFIDQSVTGGFYGEGGAVGLNVLNNPGYSSAVQCVLNLGGAAGDSLWIEAGEPPICNFHGIDDPLTPFGTKTVVVSATGNPVVQVSGSRDIAKRQQNVGNNQMWIDAGFSDPVSAIANSRQPAYEGLFWFGAGYGSPSHYNGYEPWAWYDANQTQIASASNPPDTTAFPGPWSGYGSKANPFATRAKAETYIDSVMQYFIPRLMVAFNNIDSAAVNTADPATPVSVKEVGVNIDVNMDVYPNPASDFVSIQINESDREIRNVLIYNVEGKIVRYYEGLYTKNITLPLTNLTSGVYLMNVEFGKGEMTVKKLIVE